MNEATEEGQKINTLIEETKKFYRNLALLLESAEDLLGNEQWESASAGNQVWINSSTSLKSPDLWFPKEVFRFFKNENRPNVLVFICVLLDPRDEGYERFPEPLVSATWFDYGKESVTDSSWEPWYSRWHMYLPFRYREWIQQEVSDLPERERKRHDYKFERVRSLVVPLAGIANAESLRSDIIDPLLEDIEKNSQSG